VGGRIVIEVTPRVTYWTEPHPSWQPNPEWPEHVGSALFRGSDALVLIDPLVRDDLDASAWGWLDGAVGDDRTRVAVLLTAPWHERSTRAVATRFGASVWVHPTGRGRIDDLPQLEAVPAGIEVFAPRGVDEGQVAFFIEPEQTLVVAEFLGGSDGGLRVCPSPATRDMGEFLSSLRELERLPIERVLVAHGPPVLRAGSEAISAALRSFVVL